MTCLKPAQVAIERALALDAPVWVLRVLLVVIADTALLGGTEATIPHRRIKELTGMPQRQVSRAFAWLTDNEIIGYDHGWSCSTGRRASTVCLLVEGRAA